jgi:putative ABC transport system permease protein
VINFGNIRLAKGTEAASWLADNDGALGPSVRLVSGALDAETMREVFGVAKAALAAMAAMALFVSGFLIFLTQSMSVAEAGRMHGTLRAIGASRAQVRRVVLGDAVALTVLSAPIGLLLGLGTAFGIIAVTREVYGLPHLGVHVSPFSAVVAVAVGVVVTLVSALVPARRAAAAAPAAAIRTSDVEQKGLGRMWLVGLGLAAAGVALVLFAPGRGVDLGVLVMLVGAVLTVPIVMVPLTAVAGSLTRRLARGVGTIGVLHLRKEPRRSAHTVALVMLVLSVVFATGAVHLSLRRNLVATISQRFPADLAVYAGASFNADIHARVLATPGVRAGTDLRFTRTVVEKPSAGFVYVTVLDPATFFDVQGFVWSRGSDAAVRAAFERGGSVAIPAGLAHRAGLDRGDQLTLATPAGAKSFRIAGIYQASDSDSPLLASTVDGPALLGSTDEPAATDQYYRPAAGPGVGGVGVIALAVDPGRDPKDVKAAIEKRFKGASPVFVQLTSEQKHDWIEDQTTFFQLIYAIVLIALVMGMLGLTNTLAMAVLRRTREIGILRAVGTERRGLRRMAVVESATVALAGLVLALPLGLLLSVTVLRSVQNTIGIVIEYVFPWPMFAVVAVLAVVVAIVSSIVPGRHATRVDPAQVLRVD